MAIWNFAPVHLTAPVGVLVKHENMACSLAMLSQHLKETWTAAARDK
jgi:redox-sensing transcriptional repressor